AFVTLATNDSYALGAIVWANSLRNPLDSSDPANLALLGRPNLGCTFTKLHCWRLIRYTKAVFMDSDTLVMANIDDLLEREELSAAPDPGWPDCFNSGVFVYRPSEDTYRRLLDFARSCTSFDGADQGLLNMFFNDWATKDITKHLPFTYNCVSQAFYSYLPAFRHFRRDIKVAHFIGEVKPWHHSYNSATGQVEPREGTGHQSEFLQHWWDIYVTQVHAMLPAGARLLPDSPELAEAARQRRRVLAVISGTRRLVRLRRSRLVRRLGNRQWGWSSATGTTTNEAGFVRIRRSQNRLVEALLLPPLASSASSSSGRRLRLAGERTFCSIVRQPAAATSMLTTTSTTTTSTTTKRMPASSVVVFRPATLPAADCGVQAGSFTRHTFITPLAKPDPKSVHSVRIKQSKNKAAAATAAADEEAQIEVARTSRSSTTTVTVTAAALADRLFEALHLEPPAQEQLERSRILAPAAEIDDSYITRRVEEFDESATTGASEYYEEFYDEYYDESELPVEQGGGGGDGGGGGGAVGGAAGGGNRREAWERGEIDYLGSDRFDNVLSRLRENIQD
uniref:glycogenin glucosyltransferase n=1 Tax=Macrostomum lignano TaxID=282301 RepID=A0A1I8IS51_9PLAT